MQISEMSGQVNGSRLDSGSKEKQPSPAPSPQPHSKPPTLGMESSQSATLPLRTPDLSALEEMEGMLCRKQEMESHGKKAANRLALCVFVCVFGQYFQFVFTRDLLARDPEDPPEPFITQWHACHALSASSFSLPLDLERKKRKKAEEEVWRRGGQEARTRTGSVEEMRWVG